MTIRIANAPCSWGVLEFDLEGKAAGYVQVLDEIAETGYAGTELGDWGFMPTDPVKLRAEIHARGLSLLGAFVPVMLKDPTAHAAGAATAVRTARLLAAAEGDSHGESLGGSPFIILADDNGKIPARTQNAGRIRPEHGLSEAEWNIAAEGAECVATEVKRETGLRTVVHHHCGGYVETPEEIDTLLRLTDPALVGLCLDTGHYCFGGGGTGSCANSSWRDNSCWRGDPLAFLRRSYARVWHVHFKDCHPAVAETSRREGWDYFTSVRNGIFCELGKGQIDFPAIKAELDARGFPGWIVVEQDVLPGMGSPKESALRNRRYLKNIGL